MKPEGLQQAHGALLVQGGHVSLWNTDFASTATSAGDDEGPGIAGALSCAREGS